MNNLVNYNANRVRMSNRQRNCLRWGAGETDNHIQMKLEICKYIKKINQNFISEAIFEDGSGRADVLWLEKGVCIEVVESEKEESIVKKKNKYPFPLIVVNANKKFEEKMIL